MRHTQLSARQEASAKIPQARPAMGPEKSSAPEPRPHNRHPVPEQAPKPPLGRGPPSLAPTTMSLRPPRRPKAATGGPPKTPTTLPLPQRTGRLPPRTAPRPPRTGRQAVTNGTPPSPPPGLHPKRDNRSPPAKSSTAPCTECGPQPPAHKRDPRSPPCSEHSSRVEQTRPTPVARPPGTPPNARGRRQPDVTRQRRESVGPARRPKPSPPSTKAEAVP